MPRGKFRDVDGCIGYDRGWRGAGSEMTTVRVRWAAGAGRDLPPSPAPNKYITHNVFLLEARSGIALDNQPDLLLLWQPTDTHNCTQFMATTDAAAQVTQW